MSIFGIDVSTYQGEVDWPRVAKNGIVFAVARASIKFRKDYQYERNRSGMTNAGLLGGAYHYLYPGDAPGQARFFLDQVGETEGKLCVLDVEYHGNYGTVSMDDVEGFARTFREETRGHPLIIYSGGWFWRGYMDNAPASHLGPLWDSHYIGESLARGKQPKDCYPWVPGSWWYPRYGGWTEATVLQFSSSTTVGGVTGRCDADACRGTLSSLLHLAHRQEANPAMLPINQVALSTVKVTQGTSLFDLNRRLVTRFSNDYTVTSVGQSGVYDLVVATTGGVRQLLMVNTADTSDRAEPACEACLELQEQLVACRAHSTELEGKIARAQEALSA